MTTSELVYNLETDILNKIAQYIVKGETEKYSSQWQLEKLRELGSFNAEVQNIISSYKSDINKLTKEEIDETIANVFRELRKAIPKDDNIEMTPDLKQQLDIWINGADNDINIAMAKMAELASQEYVASLNKASLSVITGQSTLREAIEMAVTDAVNAGLPPYRDKADRLWSPEAYVQMVIRSNQRRVSTDTMIDAGRQIGADRVEISSHIGARPKCAPYQGKVMTWENLYNNTSWGEKGGLNGINCGHFFYPFKDGMTQRYKPYPEERNETVYKQSQQQRKLERDIRDAKRNAKIYDTAGDQPRAQRYKDKVKAKQAELREFVKTTGRTRRNDREQIY